MAEYKRPCYHLVRTCIEILSSTIYRSLVTPILVVQFGMDFLPFVSLTLTVFNLPQMTRNADTV